MPLYAAEPSRHPGSVFPPHYPWFVTDGTGSVVEDCRAADTDTGLVVRLAAGPRGELLPDPAEPGRYLEVRESRPLPLRIEAIAPPFAGILAGLGDEADEPHIVSPSLEGVARRITDRVTRRIVDAMVEPDADEPHIVGQ